LKNLLNKKGGRTMSSAITLGRNIKDNHRGRVLAEGYNLFRW